MGGNMRLRNKKTGEIVDLSIFGITLNIRKEEQPTYHSIEQLCEDWEDYKPAEPLIKDGKIRKAVRAWAEANDFEPDYKVRYGNNSYSLFSSEESIEFNIRIEGLEHLKDYTIEELCGEEEE